MSSATRVLVILLVVTLLAATVAPTTVLAGPAQSGDAVACAQYYTVQRGDNLYRIARLYGTTVVTLRQLNGLASPDTILAGQRLCVRAQTGTPTQSGFLYTVNRGETLFWLSRRYNVSVSDLVTINRLASPHLIYAGQRLWIPSGFWYTVQRGDTLTAIGRRYNVSVAALISANDISNANRIYVGQRLWIP